MSTIYEIRKLPGDSDEHRSSLLKTAKNALDAVPQNSVVSFYGAFIGVRASEFSSKMQFARRDQDGGGLGVHLT